MDRLTGKRMEPVTTGQIYWGAMPFVVIQLIMVGIVSHFRKWSRTTNRRVRRSIRLPYRGSSTNFSSQDLAAPTIRVGCPT